MKKIKKVIMAVMTIIVLAASATFSSCQKEYSVTKGPEAPELEGIDSVQIAHQYYLEDGTEYANGQIRFACLDSVWAFKGGVSYQGTAKCVCTWSVDRSVLRDLPEDTCMAISATADPNHLIFGSSRTVVALQSAEMLYATVQVDGIEYSVKNNLFGHKCITVPYRLCTSGDNVAFWGRGDDGDTVPASGDRGRNIHDTVPVHHYDTVVVERHDTTVVVVRDTTFIIDTVTNDTIRFIVDSVVYTPHHNSESSIVFVSNILRAQCANNIATTVYRNGQVHSTTSRNFSGIFDHLYSESGTYLTSHVGMALPIAADGTVNWGSGFSQVFQHQAHYTNPSGYEPWLRYLDCDFVRDSVYGQSNGILFVGHYVCPNGNHRKTYLIPKTPQDTTTRHITGRDTAWNGCGHRVNSTVGSVTVTHLLAKTGTETINYNLPPLTETHTVTCSTAYYDQWYVSGLANPASIGSTANFSGNTLTLGGATLTITPGTHHWCPLTYISGELTANGILVTVSYNGQTGTVLFPVPFDNPEPIFTSVLAAVATDTYTHQIFSLSSYRHTYVCVVAQIGTNYRFYWAELQAGLTRADFDSVSITATEANFYVNHLADGYYPAMVCSHSDHVTMYRGVVTSEELSTGWQQTYRLAPSNNLAYVMGGSSWTMAGDNGRSAIRGIMNSTGTITADGITVQIIPSMP